VLSVGVRARKLARELAVAPGRTLAMIVAVAAGGIAVGSSLGAYTILGREIQRSYRETHPASATFELEHSISRERVEAVRQRPEVVEAEAHATVLAQVDVSGERRAMLLFVVDDFDGMRVGRVFREPGAPSPPLGTMLVERSALRVLDAQVGDAPTVRMPNGEAHAIEIAGVVHDPGLAPATMEQTGYGYVTPETLAWLGETHGLDELRVVLRDPDADRAAIEADAARVAQWLERSGDVVREVRVPPPRMHPHERQMRTILAMLSIFAGLALLLAAVLVASIVAARLAKDTHEVGVLKAIGARTSQVALGASASVLVVSTTAAAIALPVSLAVAPRWAETLAAMLNFDLASRDVGPLVPLTTLVATVLLPWIVSAVPIARASRTTVRMALDAAVAAPRPPPAWAGRLGAGLGPTWTLALRGTLRRRAWLVATLAQLAIGGAIFVTAIGLSDAWDAWADEVEVTRHYDVEVLLHTDAPALDMSEALRSATDARRVEAWGAAASAVVSPLGVPIARTYPDGGHGSFRVLAPPAEQTLVDLPVLRGRALGADDREATVLNELAVGLTGCDVGDTVQIAVDGHRVAWRVVGVVREVGSPATAYTSAGELGSVLGSPGGARLFRIALQDGAPPPGRSRAIEATLAARGAAIERVTPREMLRTAIGEHVGILVAALVALALMMMLVGALGLASSTATQLVERTREIGVLRAIGATRANVIATVVLEGALVGVASACLGVLCSLPATAGLARLMGSLSFGTPLPFVIAPGAIATWTLGVLAVSLLASALPGWVATRTTVRDALDTV
jgi:putative ABC transport system permease protein